MNILIIGSKGFIGSALTSYLKRSSHEHNVYECDVIPDHGNLNYFQIDTSDASFDQIFQNTTFTHCVNCSGAANVNESIVRPLKDYFLNTVNVFRILNAIKKQQPNCKFINLSSAAVYGNPDILPVSEETALSPISPYGLHKKQAEEICHEFCVQFGLSTLSLRIFSAYGDGLKKQIFWDMFQKSTKSKKFELFGTGMESRDFIHISDLVRAIELCMKRASFDGNAINVANGEETTIKKIAEVFIKNIDKEISFEFNQMVNEGNPTAWCADIQKLTSLGYCGQTSLEEGIASYCGWANSLQDL